MQPTSATTMLALAITFVSAVVCSFFQLAVALFFSCNTVFKNSECGYCDYERGGTFFDNKCLN